MNISVRVDEAEFNRLIKVLEAKGRAVAEKRKQALSPVADFVASAIAGRAPVSDRVHHRYRKSGKKKKGERVATYYPGNLRRSITQLYLKRSRDNWVGPLLSKGQPTGTFVGDRADGYYAHFVEYGTKWQKAQPFVDQGVIAAAPVALRTAVEILKSIIEKS